jgi:methylmalonyl-CoA mutase N-terminal domain/subunit
MEAAVRSAPEFIPPRDVFRIQCDNIEFIRRYAPKWNFITLNGYNLREFGTSGITEMAVAIANAIETCKEMERRGHGVDWIAHRLAFFWSAANDFFEEVARLRAVRRLWYRIMRYRFQAASPRAMWMRCHVQTSGISLSREEPMNNVVRAAYHALAAVLGGAQSLHVDSYDEAYSVPSEEAAVLSLRTQQIIQAETAITEVVDPVGGSFYVEALSDEIEQKILDELDEIERMGGIVNAVEMGWLQNRIATRIQREQEKISAGEIKVVGRNYFRASKPDMPEVWVHEHDESLEEEMRSRVVRIRQQRNGREASDSLDALKVACERGDNVMAHCVEAARAGATVGEMRRAFVDVFGAWGQPGQR